MTEDIKSAAQMILDAWDSSPHNCEDPEQEFLDALAATLRAAAYQLEDFYCEDEFDDCNGMIKHFLLIADEIGTL